MKETKPRIFSKSKTDVAGSILCDDEASECSDYFISVSVTFSHIIQSVSQNL
ncbi:MAG: hypothetical protein ACI8Y7_000875 [Candidatus Woesearchaeota archaeon]|jgi:hypothetical protein